MKEFIHRWAPGGGTWRAIVANPRSGGPFNMASKASRIVSVAVILALQSSPAGAVEITQPGVYKLAENISLRVQSSKDPDGLVRNEITITGTDPEGKKIVDRCALTFGEGTWGLFAKGGRGGCKFTIVDHSSVQTYQFYVDAGRARFGKARIDDEARWSMSIDRFLNGKLAQFADPEVVAWAKALLPKLKKEPAAAMGPKLEVRLVATDEESVTMVRPTFARHKNTGYRRVGRFVKLAERLLQENDIEIVGAAVFGVARTLYGVREESRKGSVELCRKHNGKKAALLIDGRVAAQFTLDPSGGLPAAP